MSQVLNFFDKWTRSSSTKASQPVKADRLPAESKLLTFAFVDEPEENTVIPSPQDRFQSAIGRPTACITSHSFVSADVNEAQSRNLTYLQRDARHETEEHADTQLFVKKSRAAGRTKVQATALLDASELIQLRALRTDSYSSQRPVAATKALSLENLRKLNTDDSETAKLERVRQICEKVSAEALINSPNRRMPTGPLRHSIKIKIG